MKYVLVALGTAGLVATVFVSKQEPAPIRERRIPVPVRVEVPVELPVPIERVRTETRVVEKTVKAEGAERGSALPASWDRMLFLFERELRLGADQRKHIQSVLQEREREIQAHNAEIRASGIFSRRQYSRRIREIRSRSYDRMAEALRDDQRRRFSEIVAEGRLGDAVAFTIDPGLVVLD